MFDASKIKLISLGNVINSLRNDVFAKNYLKYTISIFRKYLLSLFHIKRELFSSPGNIV